MKTYINTIITLLFTLTLFGLVACGGGGGGTTDPVVEPPPPPPPSTKPVDSDGDGLSDEEETALGTNINVQDTDGDGFLDKEEADNWDRNSGTHLLFNPLVADVPRIRIERLGAPVIQLYATTANSVSVNRGMTNSALSEVQVTTDRGRSNTNVVEEQHAVNVNAEVKKRGPITSGKVAASYDYQHTDTTTETDYWNEQTVETNRQESSDYFEFLRNNTVETKGGEIKILMGVLNDGDISYTLKNMDLTAYMENPQRPGDLISVGTLVYEGNMNFTPDPLGTKVNPGTGDYTPFNFVYKAIDNPEEISRILENSNQLVLRPTNLSLTGQRSDVDLNLAAQNVRARTAEIIIDFGDSQKPKTERYRVAVDTGKGSTVSFSEVMSDRLNYAFKFSSQTFSGKSSAHTGLTSVRSLAMNTGTNSYWLVAHTFTPSGGSTQTKLYNILSEDYAASDINLRTGDVLHLVYITDTDLDGLSDRLEILKGTDLNLADTDGDGLDDAEEVYGWYTNLTSPPCDSGTDLALVFSDPLKQDTDADGNDDSVEFANCSNPEGELKVEAGADVLGDTSAKITLEAIPANYQDRSTLRYSWTQTSGTSVGQLSNTGSIQFNAPANVDKLTFAVTVTDVNKPNSSATDTVSVFVLRDKTKAVFVEADLGHDFDNDGRTPDTPLRTLKRALDSSFGGADIYLNTPDSGSYVLADTIVLPADSNLYGGFDVNWDFDPVNAPTPIVVNQAVAINAVNFTDKTIRGVSISAVAPADGQVPSQAIYAANGNNLMIKEVIAQGSDLTVVQPADTDIASYNAASSYGVLAQNLARLDVIDSSVSAGKGADGVQGLAGAKGAKGHKGANASGITGGDGGGGHNGANGGKGGTAVDKVLTCKAGKVGAKGTDSSSNSGTITGGTKGAAGKAEVKFLKCTITAGGAGGSVFTRAKTGSQGQGAQNSMTFTNGIFSAGNLFSNGGKGLGGAGGGGGGSGPGANANDGGGGGGGGEGGEGGGGGAPGRGAGGSFAVAVSSVNFVSISNSQLTTASGGEGGKGGAGGVGGSGGDGGTGADTGGRKGGNGGSGSPGGYGGAGGGGAGGPVAGILLLDGSELDIVSSTITTADAGNGTNPNKGQGGWNYGIFVNNSTISANTGNSIQLGTAGNSAPPAAEINP